MADHKVVLEEKGKPDRRLYTDNLNDAVQYARDVADKNHTLVIGKVDGEDSISMLGDKRDVYIIKKP